MRLSESRVSVLEVLFACNVIKSRSEGRRLIEQGGVRIDGRLVDSSKESIDVNSEGSVLLKVGKRRYFELLSDRGTT